jgi:ATP-dependent RNA helicase RhlE
VHRVGRTGRAGRRGVGITLVTHEQEKVVGQIAHELRLHAPFAKAPGPRPRGGGRRRRHHANR